MGRYPPPFSSDLFLLCCSKVMSSDSDSNSSSTSLSSISRHHARRRDLLDQLSLLGPDDVPTDSVIQDQDELLDDLGDVLEIPEDPLIDGVQQSLEPEKGKEPESRDAKRKRDEEPSVEFQLSKSRCKKLREMFFEGANGISTKKAKSRFVPTYLKKECALQCPSIDDSVLLRLQKVKNFRADKGNIDPQDATWYSLQKKILKVANPLLFLWNFKLENETAHEAVKEALSLLAKSFGEVTRTRRQNILTQTNPSFKTMLKAAENFSDKERHLLFGNKFNKQMVKAAKDDANLAMVARLDEESRRNNKPKFRGGKTGNRGNSHSSPQRPVNQGAGPSGEHNSRIRYQSPLFSRYATQEPPYIGGRLRFFANNWQDFSLDPWIIDTVTNGLKIEFIDTPIQLLPPSNMVFSFDQTIFCDKEVSALLEKGAIRRVTNRKFISSLFIISKKSGGFRPVINLKALNKFINHNHFKMEGLPLLKHLILSGDWLAKIDLKDAYLTVPIHSDHQPFLQFKWNGSLYQFTCLPFALPSAP